MLKQTQLEAAVGAVESAYLGGHGDAQSWVDAVARALSPVMDMGEGILGWCYDAGDLSQLKLDHIAQVGLDERLLYALAQADADARNTVEIRRSHYRTIAGPFSASLGKLYRQFAPAWDEHVGPLGVRDMLVVNAMNFGFRGCAFSAPSRHALEANPIREAFLERVALHIVCAYRLRFLDADGASVPEAVLRPSGHVEHLEGIARKDTARDELQRAVRAMELARGKLRKADPAEALSMWNAMVAGRWTLVDQFESDGKRYLVAKTNPPARASIATLSERESQVVALASVGRSNKAIAYELGLAQGTIATLLKRARTKLGAANYDELLLKMSSDFRPGVAREQTEATRPPHP
jgi:DNA-binding CsgD family transcriptional regulator